MLSNQTSDHFRDRLTSHPEARDKIPAVGGNYCLTRIAPGLSVATEPGAIL